MADIKTEFDHKGIPIFMSGAGRFFADTTDGRVYAPSIAGLRKKIDKTSTFTPFKAITIDGYGTLEIRNHLVIGIDNRRGYRGLQFKTERGGRFSEIIEDTPANRKIANEYVRNGNEFDKLEKKHDAEQEKLLKRIPKRVPEPEKV